jgi:hypothetical protein
MNNMADVRSFFGPMRTALSRGKAAAKSGFGNEQSVHAQLQRLVYNGERVRVSEPAGANRNAQDHTLLNCGDLTMESKTAGAFEGGAKTMKFRDGAFQLPNHPLLREMVLSVTTLPLWDGFVPSCMKGDKSEAAWLAEKDRVKDIRHEVPSSVVAEYYRTKGTQYIQVEGNGLYHTGEDVKGWGVPKFEPSCEIRIRMKQHHGGCVPQDCQASFNYKRRTLPPSPYDFMNSSRLPPGFTLAEE